MIRGAEALRCDAKRLAQVLNPTEQPTASSHGFGLSNASTFTVKAFDRSFGTGTARQSHRDSLLQSRADDETRRGGPRIGDLKRDFGTVKALAEKLEKTPVEVNDTPGFVSNRVLMPLLNEAMYAVMEGVATPESVDEVFKLGMAHPMGPLTLADFIGLDVCLDIMRVMQSGLGDPKYRPCPLLIKMVDAGWLGRKSRRGFYQY